MCKSCDTTGRSGYDLSPISKIVEEQASPEDMARYLDTVEEKLLSYILTDEHAGGPVGIESEWYYLRQLRKAFEQISK